MMVVDASDQVNEEPFTAPLAGDSTQRALILLNAKLVIEVTRTYLHRLTPQKPSFDGFSQDE